MKHFLHNSTFVALYKTAPVFGTHCTDPCCVRCFWKFYPYVKTVGGAWGDPGRHLPNNITLIHFSHQTVSCSFWAWKSANTDKWWLLFSSWTMRTGFVRTICHCIDITAALLLQRIRVRHLKSRKQSPIIQSRHPSTVKPWLMMWPSVWMGA